MGTDESICTWDCNLVSLWILPHIVYGISFIKFDAPIPTDCSCIFDRTMVGSMFSFWWCENFCWQLLVVRENLVKKATQRLKKSLFQVQKLEHFFSGAWKILCFSIIVFFVWIQDCVSYRLSYSAIRNHHLTLQWDCSHNSLPQITLWSYATSLLPLFLDSRETHRTAQWSISFCPLLLF